jgi:guanine deaminase
VDAIMTAAQQRGMRMIAGKVLQDRTAPTACATRPSKA